MKIILAFLLFYPVLGKLLSSDVESILLDALVEINNAVLALKHSSINVITAADSFKRNLKLKDFIDSFLMKSFTLQNILLQLETSKNLRKDFNQRRQSILFVVSGLKDFIEIYQKISSKEFRLNGFYVAAFIDGDDSESEQIFALLWKIKIHNVIALFNGENEVNVRTFMPFSPVSCNDTSSILINKFKDGKFVKGIESLFPSKMKNLHNCPIRVSIANNTEPSIFAKRYSNNGSYQLSGRDIELIKVLSDNFHFKINFTFIGPHGYFYENGSALGPLRSLLDDEADLSISDLWLREDRLKFLDITTTYFNDDIIFVIPPGRDLTKFEKILFPFSLYLWLSILSCLLIGVLVILIVKLRPKSTQDLVFGSNVANPYLNMFTAIVGGTQKVLPKKSFARFLLITFLIYSLVIRTVYQGSFYKLVQSNEQHKKVQSIDEMIVKDFTFYVYKLDVDLFQGTEAIKKRLFPILVPNEIEVYLRKIQSDPYFKGALGRSQIKMIYTNQMSPRSLQYKICKDTVLMIPIVIYTQKDFNLLEAINEKIEIMKSSGLIKFWHEQFIDQRLVLDDVKTPKVLNVEHLMGCFQLWIFGSVICISVFCVEMFKKNLKRF